MTRRLGGAAWEKTAARAHGAAENENAAQYGAKREKGRCAREARKDAMRPVCLNPLREKIWREMKRSA